MHAKTNCQATIHIFSYGLCLDSKDKIWNRENKCSNARRKEEKTNPERIYFKNIYSKDTLHQLGGGKRVCTEVPSSLPTFIFILYIQDEM